MTYWWLTHPEAREAMGWFSMTMLAVVFIALGVAWLFTRTRG